MAGDRRMTCRDCARRAAAAALLALAAARRAAATLQGHADRARRRPAARARARSNAPTSATPAARRRRRAGGAGGSASSNSRPPTPRVALDAQPAADAEAARAAAQTAEKAGAAVLLTDLPADWTLAVADAVKLPVLNVGDAADRAAPAGLPRAPVPPAAQRAHARRRAGADAGGAQVEQGAAARRPERADDAAARRHGAGVDQALRPARWWPASRSSCRPTRASATWPTRCC